MHKLKNHDLIHTFLELKGNPKWSIMTEPLWYIPYALFTPFASLYMYQLGLTSEQIGITISVGFFLQVFFSLLGGIITDKLGRRKTTLIFDFISWTIPCLIWAFAQNFWWFLAAAVINASFQITNASWNCLFIEDCPNKHLTNAYTLIHLCGMLSVFFSPIAIYFVDKHSVVQVVSIIYLISGISMGIKFFLLYIFGNETIMGQQRMLETKDVSYLDLMKGYGEVFGKILKSSRMLFVVLFMGLTNIILITTNSFFSLYITQELQLADQVVAVFPMIRTLIMLVFVGLLQNAVNRLKMKNSLLVGFLLYFLSHVVLLLAPEKNLLLVVIYTILEAMAYAIISPRKDALMAFYVEIKERSRIFAIFNAGMIAISAPFGYIVGKMFEVNHMYPFFFNIIIFSLSAALVLRVKAIASYDEESQG
ncbi:MAG: MFS transporter [Eubacteriales bacterium]